MYLGDGVYAECNQGIIVLHTTISPYGIYLTPDTFASLVMFAAAVRSSGPLPDPNTPRPIPDIERDACGLNKGEIDPPGSIDPPMEVCNDPDD